MNIFFKLVEDKYRMYNELYKFKPYASTCEECFNRIELKAKYTYLLELINQLPLKESQDLEKIEAEFFDDYR